MDCMMRTIAEFYQGSPEIPERVSRTLLSITRPGAFRTKLQAAAQVLQGVADVGIL